MATLPPCQLAAHAHDVFAATTRRARECGAVNLSQGAPTLRPPEVLRARLVEAFDAGQHQYSPSPGRQDLRETLARSLARRGVPCDAEATLTVTSGCTEALALAVMTVVRPGDEIVALEPFYDSYPALATWVGARFVGVPLLLEESGVTLDLDRLEHAITARTRALILNTPHNPTGAVLSEPELKGVAELAQKHDLWVISDEVYEELVYEGEHRSIAALPGMAERTLLCSSTAKSLTVTGWRVGWLVAPREVTAAAQAVHRFLTYCAPMPLQAAMAGALEWAYAVDYFDTLRAEYRERRDLLFRGLEEAGLRPVPGAGTYFLVARCPGRASREVASRLMDMARVAPLPLETFYSDPERANGLVRFAYCHERETLGEAVARLRSHKREVGWS